MSTAAFAPTDRELVLDRYRPLRPLGRGGSGSVWLARDERTGLEVALKIVPREGKRAARAMREMEAASRLRHDRCVRAYGFGGDDGHVYIAYEYVAGHTLRELLRSGRVGDREAIEVATQTLDALAHAHRHGIVHRDVKPSNVLVEDRADVSVRLLDFGLAQFDDADTLTAMGDVPGTLAYIAPERLAGQDASEKSDVWAVGVMLWEALAGQHPFWGVPLSQVAGAIEDGAPPLATERRDLPSRLLAAVDSALAVSPERRPSAAGLAQELREAFVARAPRPARTPRPTPLAKPRRMTAPTPPGIRVAGGALCAAAAGFGSSVLPFWSPGLVGAIAVAAGLLWAWSPRVGLALALAAPILPLGNEAKGAAVAWSVVAVAWLALSWRRPREGLVFATGPLLAAVGLIALLPLATQLVRGSTRRTLHTVAGVLASVAAAGLVGAPLPFTGGVVGYLGVSGVEEPLAIAGAAADELTANPGIVGAAVVLSLTALLLPHARRLGLAALLALAVAQLTLLLATPGVLWRDAVAGSVVLLAVLAARPAGAMLAAHRRSAVLDGS